MILSIETSTSACSVALHRQGQLLVCIDLLIDQSHSGMLTTLIDNALQSVSKTYKDLTGIAVAAGPGSYTGLRIGIATAKGLCFALNLPLFAVSTLAALTRAVIVNQPINNTNDVLFCPLLDARRMEVYTALYDKKFRIIQPPHALVITSKSFSEEVTQQKIICFGNGSDKCQSVLTHPNFVFLPEIKPSASQIGSIASQLTADQAVDLAYFEPFYLKEYQFGGSSK